MIAEAKTAASIITPPSRGNRCMHRAAIEIKICQGYHPSSEERDCLYACNGMANSCSGSYSFQDQKDFNELFHRHLF